MLMVTNIFSLDKEDTPYHLNKESIENEALFINEDTDGGSGGYRGGSARSVDLPMSRA